LLDFERLDVQVARVVLLVGISTFIALAASALLLPTFPAELVTRQAMLHLDTGWAAGGLRLIDHAGTWKVILPGSLIVLALSRRARAQWWVWTVALLAAPAAETFFKLVIGRPRPESTTMGFPSGHATAAAAFFGSVIYLAAPLPKARRYAVRTLAVLCIALVSVSRISLGAHWPTDVLAGLALGISLASAALLVAAATRPAGPGSRNLSDSRGAPSLQRSAPNAGGLGD
jgi:membrane-associated phospholipid phosphatase